MLSDQFDLIVEGDGVDGFASKGDYLRCIKIFGDWPAGQNQIMAVVERYAEPNLVEITIRKIIVGVDGEMVILDQDGKIEQLYESKNGSREKKLKMKITGKVLYKYRLAG